MANEEQLALLRQGVEVWNAWREENPHTKIDLSKAYLVRADFHKVNLYGADLTDTNLRYAHFREACLIGAKLINAELQDTYFVGADLTGADLSNAKIIRTNFVNTNLNGIDCSNAELSGANFVGAKLRNSNFSNARVGINNSRNELLPMNFGNPLQNNATFEQYPRFIGADFSNANLNGANFSNANLSNTNLSNANLSEASLSTINLADANLSHSKLLNADLSDATLTNAMFDHADLSGANIIRANLNSANLREATLNGANLSEANLSKANLRFAKLRFAALNNANLNAANLNNADLMEASLTNARVAGTKLGGAKLIGANLTGAQLNGANLYASQVLFANFTQAILTGACIADWQDGSSTILEEVKCDYIFRTYDEKEQKFTGRLPIDPESTFAPGEFTQRFQIIASALETIDITFTDGIDWQAFFQSFQDLRCQRPDQSISIQGMERKGQAFIVRLEVEANVDKAAIETQIKQLYANQLAALEAQYEKQLRLQSEEIAHYRQTQSSLLHIVQTMAEKDPITQNFNAPVGNVAATNHGKMQNIQHIYAPEQQDLSEAAKEIQKLLNTLTETYNTNTDAGKERLMNELGNEVKKHPKWRRALKEGGIELIKVLCAPIGIPLEMARVYLEDE